MHGLDILVQAIDPSIVIETIDPGLVLQQTADPEAIPNDVSAEGIGEVIGGAIMLGLYFTYAILILIGKAITG